MIDPLELTAFFNLRQRTFAAIEKVLKLDSYSKSYEGRFSITFPSYFASKETEPAVCIELACYVIGPSRSYRWTGHTFGEALDAATKDIDRMIQELDEDG